MFNHLINITVATGVTGVLYFFCDFSVEASLMVGFTALIAYGLMDISRHLRNRPTI